MLCLKASITIKWSSMSLSSFERIMYDAMMLEGIGVLCGNIWRESSHGENARMQRMQRWAHWGAPRQAPSTSVLKTCDHKWCQNIGKGETDAPGAPSRRTLKSQHRFAKRSV